jgi:hypothetical protein
MNQNYCEVKLNKIYAEIYDELLDEELSMNNPEHNDKIKTFIDKKIKKSDFLRLSEIFTDREDIISDLILKITEGSPHAKNLQGNTLILYANEDTLYELFYMEDLTKTIDYSDDDLNEFACISNIDLLPVYWGAGIFKTSYSNGILKGEVVSLDDISKLFIQNYYHKGVMINTDGSIIELEFTGESPFKTIGNNYTQLSTMDVVGFSVLPFQENNSDKLNELGSKLLGQEIRGRVFLTLLCPATNKKYWDLSIKVVEEILKILDNQELVNEIYSDRKDDDIYVNPFYVIKKLLNRNKSNSK